MYHFVCVNQVLFAQGPFQKFRFYFHFLSCSFLMIFVPFFSCTLLQNKLSIIMLLRNGSPSVPFPFVMHYMRSCYYILSCVLCILATPVRFTNTTFLIGYSSKITLINSCISRLLHNHLCYVLIWLSPFSVTLLAFINNSLVFS